MTSSLVRLESARYEETDVQLAKNGQLCIDEGGHAMSNGRVTYLLRCAEERGRDMFRRRSTAATKGLTRPKPAGAKPRKRARKG